MCVFATKTGHLFIRFSNRRIYRIFLPSRAWGFEIPEDRDSARLYLDTLNVPGVLDGRDPLNKSMFVWSKSVLPNYILNLLGDRMEMAHSVEGRVPFLARSGLSRTALHIRPSGVRVRAYIASAASNVQNATR